MRIAGIASVCVIAGALAPAPARAEPPSSSDVEAARAHYRLGVQLYEQHRYEEALVELQRANSLAPTYRLLYDIALVQRQLGDAAGALRSFGSYLDAGADIPAVRRAEVARAISELTAKVATVTVTSNVSGAEISDDDRVVGTTPLPGPLWLNPGPHRMAATKAGYRPDAKSIDVAGGDRIDLPFALEEVPPPAPGPPPAPSEAPLLPPSVPEAATAPSPPPSSPASPPPPPPAPERRSPPTWIGWTATGVLAAGAVATGIAALVESHTLQGDIGDHPTPAATIRSAHATTAALALASDVLSGAALVAGGITLYVRLASKPHAASPPRAELHAGPGSLWLSATF